MKLSKIIHSLILGLCATSLFAQTTTVSGTVTGAVTNVTVTIKGPDFEKSATLGADGTYEIEAVPVGTEVTLTVDKDDSHLNGVTTFDLVQGLQHILLQAPFEETRQYVAADVNQSTTVSIRDLILQRRAILGEIDTFPNVDSWRFIEQNQFEAIEMDACGYSGTFTNQFQVTDSQNIFNFVAVKIADINGNAVP